MISINELYDAVNSIPQFGMRGSKKELSFPFVLHHEDSIFYGFMVSYYGENIPDGFVLYNSKTEESRFYKNSEIAREFGIPISEAIRAECSTKPAQNYSEDLFSEFEQATMQGTLRVDAYNKYLMKVMSAVIPEKRKFYKMFFIGGEQ